jgi:hypothetical protein
VTCRRCSSIAGACIPSDAGFVPCGRCRTGTGSADYAPVCTRSANGDANYHQKPLRKDAEISGRTRVGRLRADTFAAPGLSTGVAHLRRDHWRWPTAVDCAAPPADRPTSPAVRGIRTAVRRPFDAARLRGCQARMTGARSAGGAPATAVSPCNVQHPAVSVTVHPTCLEAAPLQASVARWSPQSGPARAWFAPGGG